MKPWLLSSTAIHCSERDLVGMGRVAEILNGDDRSDPLRFGQIGLVDVDLGKRRAARAP